MDYFVLGNNGEKYGPADIVTLNVWISEGRIRAADIRKTAANPRAVNAGSMESCATSTVIIGKKICYVSYVWSVTKCGVGIFEIK